MADKIFWLGHDSFRLTGEKTVYIDPWKLADGIEKADVILVTHEHRDHYSKEDIVKISQASTVVVAPSLVAQKFDGKVTVAKPGDTLNVNGVQVEAVPA